MSTHTPASIPGIVKNGVVVPQTDASLAEGTHVEIMLEPAILPAELRAEIQAWDQVSDEAWAMIDKWEAEE